MMHFKNLGGTHAEGDLLYPKGAIVPSEKNLVAAFPLHFERVSLKATKGAPVPFPLATNPGDIPAPPEPVDEGEGGEEDSDTEPEKRVTSSKLGEDVTEDFPNAAKAELRVFKNAGKFFLAFADSPSVALNKRPLVKNKVSDAIAEYTSEE